MTLGFEVTTLAVTVLAAFVAIRQLVLQRAEVERSALVTVLVQLHTATLAEIEHYERIIDDTRHRNLDVSRLASRVNNELRPLHLSLTAYVASATELPPNSSRFRTEAKKLRQEVIPLAAATLKAKVN